MGPLTAARPIRRKSLWLQQLEMLESLSLETVAAEVNEARWRSLMCTLAAPSATEKKKMTRLIRLYETGKLHELPSDLRADANRMGRILVALHRRFGKFGAGVVEIPRLASDAKMGDSSAERGIRDLVEARLIDADRKRKRLRLGGQGPSRYQFVWSSLRDIAFTQGIQKTLFDGPGGSLLHSVPSETVEIRHLRPAVTVSGADGRLPCPVGETDELATPPPCEGAPPHCEGAPPHKPRANARAGASLLTSMKTSSSPSLHSLSQPAPSAGLAEPASTEKKKISGREDEDDLLRDPLWAPAIAAADAYGVYRPALFRARSHGWSPDQVASLFAACEAKSVGLVRAWGAGLVFRHLQLASPGAAIESKPGEAFLRARRDRDLEAQRQRELKSQESQSARRRDEADESAALLAALSEADRLALAESVAARIPLLARLLQRGIGDSSLQAAMARELKSRKSEVPR